MRLWALPLTMFVLIALFRNWLLEVLTPPPVAPFAASSGRPGRWPAVSSHPEHHMSTEAALSHHLQAFSEGVDAIMQDYTPESVLFTPDGPLLGLEPIRAFFHGFLIASPPAAPADTQAGAATAGSA